MTRLLISVRDADEAATALAGGVDLLDIKEPDHGALGAASPAVWRDVLAVSQGRVPTSAALGELLEDTYHDDNHDDNLLARFQYAKIGLAGCGTRGDWLPRWSDSLRHLPPNVAPVAVVYADWIGCQAPPPLEIIHQAARLRCQAILFDTHDKSGGNLFAYLPTDQLKRLVAMIRRAGQQVVLGGSLEGQAITTACRLRPDYIAVRGAACRGSRRGSVDLERVRSLIALLQSNAV
jgi:(5-formylfuran-3-yl)methyl phosphate synthase